MAFCENCGAELSEGAKFCGNCGKAATPIRPPSREVPTTPPVTRKPEVKKPAPEPELARGKNLAKAFVIMVGVLILIIYFGVFYSSNPTQNGGNVQRVIEEKSDLGTGILDIKAEKDNQFLSGDYVNQYYTYAYDCKWSGLDVKCDGEIQYIGPPNLKLTGAHLAMWCRDKRSCLSGKDQVEIQTMDRQIYTLSCDVGEKKDLEVNLEIGDGVRIYSSPPGCT